MSERSSTSRTHLGPELDRELDAWSATGLTAPFWWRDDDAVTDTPALRTLADTARQAGVTLAVGVVPERADESVLPPLAEANCPLWQHGWGHHFHDDGEFGPARPLDQMIEDALRGQQTLDRTFGTGAWQRVFVPPNHQLSMAFKALIPSLGYAGVSAGVPLTPELDRVHEVNAEIDVMDWPAGKILALEKIRAMIVDELQRRRFGLVAAQRPIGILTHHLAFDRDAWSAVSTIVNALLGHPAVRFERAADVFPPSLPQPAFVSGVERPAVSVVVTSCGRQDLLARTLESFFAYNTYPACDLFVIEDGPLETNGDLVERYRGRNIRWIATGTRVGQIAAIDRAYAEVRTDYIFHCEDDWEFYAPGFIEKSLTVLQANPFILQVWLRSLSDTNDHPVLQPVLFAKSVPYRLLHPDFHSAEWGVWHGFSWNPGLRRRGEYDLVGSFLKFKGDQPKKSYEIERDVAAFYRRAGFMAAILADNDGEGYVRHLGWGRRVADPSSGVK